MGTTTGAGRLAGTTALVTGASSGIGAATAQALHAEGATVVAVARREDRLRDLAERLGERLVPVTADLVEADAATRAVDAAIGATGRLDVLVNNAGVMLLGPVVDGSLDDQLRMLEINTAALLRLTHAALPHLLRAAADPLRSVADLVNVSSLGGRRASEGSAAYALTKFGLGGYSESLRQEVTERHVRVGLVEPGATETELRTHLSPDLQRKQAARYEQVQLLLAEDVADAITWMVTRPRHVAVNEVLVRPTEQKS